MNKDLAQYWIVRLSQELHLNEKDIAIIVNKINEETKKLAKVES